MAAACRTFEGHNTRAVPLTNRETLGRQCDLLMEGTVCRYTSTAREVNRVREGYRCAASGGQGAYVLAASPRRPRRHWGLLAVLCTGRLVE